MAFLNPFQMAYGLIFGLTLLYSLVGLIFVYRDSEAVQGCHSGENIVWPTTLWHYCLASTLLAPAAVLLILQSPIQRAGDALRQMATRRDRAEHKTMRAMDPKLAAKTGAADWVVMCLGSWLVSVGLVLDVLCYWGYAELWLTRDLCRDPDVAFKEIDLWTFGCVSFIVQVVVGVVLLVIGFACWAAPMALEVLNPSNVGRPPSMPKPASKAARVGGPAGDQGAWDQGHYGSLDQPSPRQSGNPTPTPKPSLVSSSSALTPKPDPP